MTSFVEFVSRLIYGSGAEAEITPNHRTWVQNNTNSSGEDWMTHHVDRMLPAYESWLAAEHLPPVLPWTGEDPLLMQTGSEVPLEPGLDGSFTGIGSLDALGEALRTRFDRVATPNSGLGDLEKAPFSYRYWGYVKWASMLRDVFRGEIVVPPREVRDGDGTRLSAVPFTDAFNELHWSWHGNASPATRPTPGLSSSVGQHAGLGGLGLGPGEEFIRFHGEHTNLFNNWLSRTDQPPVVPTNMSEGWPQPSHADQNPSTWTEPESSGWANDPSQADQLRVYNSLDTLGESNTGLIHGRGHSSNGDISWVESNNYSPRFHAWHGWIDNQRQFRTPRFGAWNSTTKRIDEVFEPVLENGDDFPGMQALTIVRDSAGGSDRLVPADAIPDVNFAAGSGTLRLRCYVEDPYDRPVEFELTAEVYDGNSPLLGGGTTVETSTSTHTIGDTTAGDDFDLETEFVVPIQFTSAFESDDPSGTNAAVGFENSRIRLIGTLRSVDDPSTPEDESDPGFVHQTETTVQLLGEKEAPNIDLYFDRSSFGENQVESEMASGTARFEDALIVAVQDRTSEPAPIQWPSEVSNEVKGLIRGRVPAAGLFDDASHAPTVELVDPSSGNPVSGVTLELASGPVLEDATLADNLPQRYTYRYDVVFTSMDAFAGLPVGGSDPGQVRVTAADRAGNEASETAEIKFLRDANPFMVDGDPSWLSVDTRVFRLSEDETKFGATLQPGQPNSFIQQAIANLNSGSTSETFEDLSTNADESALEYSTSITNRETGETRNVHNFALAKVRLQGTDGAEDVRAFFRLFRTTASNLVFDPNGGYRTHSGGRQKIPLLGFEDERDGARLTSIPFFAEERVPHGTAMTAQTDATNVHTFAPGPSEERVYYFGAYLDINRSDARLPATHLGSDPDGGFAAGEVQPIRTLMRDAHQCMVVEVNFDGDPTEAGETPANSDNLAQRNLVILTTDNPGTELTHSVQHSFELDTGRRLRLASERPPLTHVPERTDDVLVPAPAVPMDFVSSDEFESLVQARAINLAYYGGGGFDALEDPDEESLEQARADLERERPLRFDAANWQATGALFDELLFEWGNLPDSARVELYLPRVNCEHVVNLRNLRHAPADVRLVDSHTLSLLPDGLTYIPLPPTDGDRIAGLVTIALPDDVRTGQEYVVDVTHVRAGEERSLGGFTLDIQVSAADEIVDGERRLLEVMAERLALIPPEDIWHPVLTRRVETIRARAVALAESAGVEFDDPTVWLDPETGDASPLDGPKFRVVLEKIQILDDQDTWLKGAGEIAFSTAVYSPSNGGIEQTATFPESGTFSIDSGGVLHLDAELFEGRATDELRVRIEGAEADAFDPDDTVGTYTRVLSGSATDWFGSYGPEDEHIDPEEMNAWNVWYRIEPV